MQSGDEIVKIFTSFTKRQKSDIILYSFLLLPVVLAPWILFLKQLDALLHIGTVTSHVLLVIAFLSYCYGALQVVQANAQTRRLETARDLIYSRLISRNRKIIRYAMVRKYIDKDYGDDFLNRVIASYPLVLRRGIVKGELAIGRVIVPVTIAPPVAGDDEDEQP